MDYTTLPSSPNLLINLIDLCYKPDVSFEELESVIQKDAALCTRILAISNSSAYRQWNEVKQLKKILVVLGVKTVKRLAITTAVHQFFSQFSNQLEKTFNTIWIDSLKCAHLTKSLAGLTAYSHPDEAYLAGLLHKLGQLILLTKETKDYLDILDSATTQSELLYREQEHFGNTSVNLAAEIIEQWELNSFLGDAIRYQHKSADLLLDTDPLVRLLNLSAKVSNRLNQRDKDYLVEDTFFGLNQSLIDNLFLDARESAKRDASAFGIEFSENEEDSSTVIENARIKIDLARQVRDTTLIEGMRQDIVSPLKMADLTLTIEQNLQLLYGLSSPFFFFPDKQNSRIIADINKYGNDAQNKSLSIELQRNRSLLSEAILDNKIYITYDQTALEELPIIDRQIRKLLYAPYFICIPLVKGADVVGGIIVGCNESQAYKFSKKCRPLYKFAAVVAEFIQENKNHTTQVEETIRQQNLNHHIDTRQIIHEINNPLTIINNYLEILALDLAKQSDKQTHIKLIKGEVKRVSELLLQLRDEPVENELQFSTININQLIENTIEIFKPTFLKLNNIKSKLRLDARCLEVKTDKRKLKQIFINLLRNATEALDKNGLIVIETNALVVMNNKKYMQVSIADNGPGIDEKVLEHIFTPVKSTKGVEHSGLGLTIVNQLVSELGGQITYTVIEDGGSKFTILLPYDEAR